MKIFQSESKFFDMEKHNHAPNLKKNDLLNK